MALRPVSCLAERYGTGGEGHILLRGGEGALARFAGQAQAAIVDRPMAARTRFLWKAGADDWMTGRSSLKLTVHHSRNDGLEEYLSLLQADLEAARELLSATGSVYVFADQRASAHVRLLLDDIFGRSGFLNEIIWAREAGMRPSGRFTRSHDTIFLYRKGRRALFNAGAAGRERGRLKSHMRRGTEGGRAYYAREAGGRIYRYFEDDTVSIGDVWADIPEIAPKDEERTGWEGQRPEALVDRMISASTSPGGLVCDLYCGAGTVAASAQKLGRRALILAASPAEAMLARRRLLQAGAGGFEIGAMADPLPPPVSEAALSGGNAVLQSYHRLGAAASQPGTLVDDGLGSLEYWAVGRLRDGIFFVSSHAMRTRRQPTLPCALPVGQGEGEPCVQLVDATGEQWFYLID